MSSFHDRVAKTFDRVRDADQVGPRGGTTTISSSGRVKKNLWITGTEAQALRERAYRDRRSEADIMREGLRQILNLPQEG